MAPSNDAEGRIQTYLTVLKYAKIEFDWKAYATELGMSETGNAQRKFKTALKKDGYELIAGKITPSSGAVNTPKPAATPSKRKKSTAKDEDEDAGSPSKKKKAKSDDDGSVDESA